MKGRHSFHSVMPAQAGTQVTYQRRRATSMRQTLIARGLPEGTPSMRGGLFPPSRE
jgi:hypothetical protein